MISRVVYRRQPGRRLLTGLAALSIVAGTLVVVSSNAIAFTQTNFELDKNATHTLRSSHLGSLQTSVTSSATSFVVCDLSNPLVNVLGNPVTPSFTIQIDAEQMTVTAVSAANTKSTGGCSFSDPSLSATDTRTYTITRGVNGTTAAAHVATTPRNEVTLIETTSGNDWDQVYNSPVTNGLRDCSGIGAVACIWKTRPNTGTATQANGYTGPTTFTGTSGDTQPISAWTWTNQSVPDADEINDAFAAKFSGTDQNLFVGMDRYAVNGSKDIGFWFFHQAVSPNPDGSFSGAHCYAGQTTDGCTAPLRGDILLLTTFTAGGGTATARAYEWVGNGPGAATSSDGPLNFLGSFGDCVPGNATDKGCATTANTSVNSPWSHTEKPTGASGNVFYAGGFMEGGIDLTALGTTGCFASFMGTSRSSPSLTAQPKAFVLGGFEACTSSLKTTPSAGQNGSVAIGSNGTVSVSDSVTTLNITGASTWSGSLAFYLCGPIATGTCDGTTNVGTQVGTSQTINQSTTVPITSSSTSVTSAGRYCWRAVFTSATNGVPNASDSSSTECFTVTPLTPTITTQVKLAADNTNVTAAISPGVAIYDTASLSGGTSNAGGTVQYRIYTDSSCTVPLATTAGTAYNSQADATVTNGVAAKSANITLNDAGTYYFQATYNTGDANNVAGAVSSCSSEIVTVKNSPAPHSTPAVQIQDSVTVSGLSASPTGNLVVGLYTNSGCTTRASGTSDQTFAIGSGPFTTNWVTVLANTYYFKLSYAGDSLNNGFTDCTENVGVTITSLP